MSRLPEAYEANSIKLMSPGEVWWVVPWAMYADEDRILWINGSYTINTRPGGTVQLRIQRTRDGVNVIEESIKEHRYSPGKPCFVGEFTPLPVNLVATVEEVDSPWS